MTGWIVAVAIWAIVVVMFFFVFFRMKKMLSDRLRDHLFPAERVVFESWAHRFKGGWRSIFSLTQGVVMITDRRFLFGAWIFPPVWRLSEDIPLADIEEIEESRFLFASSVVMKAHGARTLLLPTSSLIFPLGSRLGTMIKTSISQGRTALQQ